MRIFRFWDADAGMGGRVRGVHVDSWCREVRMLYGWLFGPWVREWGMTELRIEGLGSEVPRGSADSEEG